MLLNLHSVSGIDTDTSNESVNKRSSSLPVKYGVLIRASANEHDLMIYSNT